MLDRRDFLKRGSLAGVAGLIAASPTLRIALAQPGSPASANLLVVVRLRGGCDGLHLVCPASDADLLAARVADLRVAIDGTDAGHALANGLGGGIDWRLHPATPELAALYRDQRLAIVHAAGVPDANRSHFVATDMMDHGVGDTRSLSRIDGGWIARHLAAAGGTGLIDAVSAASMPDGGLRGDATALSIPDAAYGFASPGGEDTNAVLTALYDAPSPGVNALVGARGAGALAAMRIVDARIPRDARGKPLPYQADPPGAYDRAAEFGRGLRTLAQLVKSGLPISVATVDLGSWDTHENQPGRLRGLAERLSVGLGAFWADLHDVRPRLRIVAFSEFGRRLRSNRSNGTDHGRAGVMLVMGAGVAGGRMYGRWPGLADAQLEEGVDLAVTTDYRQVLHEVLCAHAAPAFAGPAFPGFSASAPLGLFPAA